MLAVIQRCFVCFVCSVENVCLSWLFVLVHVVEFAPQVVVNQVVVVDEKVVVVLKEELLVELRLVPLEIGIPGRQVVVVRVVELQQVVGGPPIDLAVDFVQHHAKLSHPLGLKQTVHTQRHHGLGCAQLALSGDRTATIKFCCQDPCQGIWLFCSHLAFCGILLSNASRQATSQAWVPECFLDWSSSKVPSSRSKMQKLQLWPSWPRISSLQLVAELQP